MKNQLNSILNYSLIAFFLIANISCSNDPSKKIKEENVAAANERLDNKILTIRIKKVLINLIITSF